MHVELSVYGMLVYSPFVSSENVPHDMCKPDYSDQSAHVHHLIRVFPVCKTNLQVLVMQQRHLSLIED